MTEAMEPPLPPPPRSARPDERGGGLRRSVPRWAGIAIFVYLTVAGLAYAEEFLVPIVLAFLLTMIFAPVRRYFDRRGIPSALTSFAIVLTLLFVLLGLLGALAVPVTGWIGKAPQIERKVAGTLGGLSRSFNGILEADKKLGKMLEAPAEDVQKVEVQGNGLATAIAGLAPTAVTEFVFTLVLLLFLLASGDMFYEKLVHAMPTLREKKRAVQIAHDIERRLSHYLSTIALINVGLGAAVGLAMWAVGLPNPLLFGVMAFLFNFVPYLGALAGICIVAAAALASLHWPGWSLVAAGLYLGIATIEGQLVTPYFVGRRLRLNTVVVFVAVSFWAWLWSAVGMMVAVPLLIAIQTFCEHVPHLAALGDFLSERHAEDGLALRDEGKVRPPRAELRKAAFTRGCIRGTRGRVKRSRRPSRRSPRAFPDIYFALFIALAEQPGGIGVSPAELHLVEDVSAVPTRSSGARRLYRTLSVAVTDRTRPMLQRAASTEDVPAWSRKAPRDCFGPNHSPEMLVAAGLFPASRLFRLALIVRDTRTGRRPRENPAPWPRCRKLGMRAVEMLTREPVDTPRDDGSSCATKDRVTTAARTVIAYLQTEGDARHE